MIAGRWPMLDRYGGASIAIPTIDHRPSTLRQGKLISNPFHSCYTVDSEFLADFPDVNINCTVAYNYIVPPDLV